jgi:hypothetical protein
MKRIAIIAALLATPAYAQGDPSGFPEIDTPAACAKWFARSLSASEFA